MFALFLNHDGNVSANLAGDGFRRKVEIRGRRNAELHGSRHRFQLPVAIGAGIPLDGNTSGCRMRLYIARRAFNFDFATGSIRLNSTTGP